MIVKGRPETGAVGRHVWKWRLWVSVAALRVDRRRLRKQTGISELFDFVRIGGSTPPHFFFGSQF